MQQVIGIGETIIDILFKNGQPISANPGGSTFNSFISLGRMGIRGKFISEIGNDALGNIVREFLQKNGLTDEYISSFPDGKTPLSIAFLNSNNDAEYSFYKDYPKQRLNVSFPNFEENDILLFGSFFSLNPVLRPRVEELLQKATAKNAIVYYDPNFRASHLHEVEELRPTLEKNFSVSDIVRGSDEDFFFIYNEKDLDAIYEKVRTFCHNFICTCGAKGVYVCTPQFRKMYESKKIEPKSTIGAGDSFNAGIIYALIHTRIQKKELPLLPQTKWNDLIRCATEFSANVCCNIENYVSEDFQFSFE